MATFNVFIKNKKPKITKLSENKLEGFEFIKTINSSTKAMALKQIEGEIKSGSLFKKSKKNTPKKESISKKEELIIVKPDTISKAIYCDFNGVLDDKELENTVTERNDFFRLPAITCPHKVMKVMQLAIKHNAKIICISMYRNYGFESYELIFNRCIANCGIQKYIDFFEENEDIIEELLFTKCTDTDISRNIEVKKHIIENKYSHFVVFEDEHHIDQELNLIRTSWSTGLLDEHIEKADTILSNCL